MNIQWPSGIFYFKSILSDSNNKEYIRSFQDQQTGQQKDQEPEQTSQISQPEQQNKSLAPANQELQEQIETNWKKLKETPLRTQHIQELTTEMLLLKEREQKLTGQLIAIHPLMNELRNSPRFMRPEDLAVLRKLTDDIYQDFTSRLNSRFTNLTDVDIQLCILIKLGFSISQIAILRQYLQPPYPSRNQEQRNVSNSRNQTVLLKEKRWIYGYESSKK